MLSPLPKRFILIVNLWQVLQRIDAMTLQEFEALRADVLRYAVAARNFAAHLDTSNERGARAWHALADRLHEASDQTDDMAHVVTPTRP